MESTSTFFQELHKAMSEGFDLQLNISIMPDGAMGLIAQPRFKDAKSEELARKIRAVHMFGTPAEFDQAFVQNLVRPIDHVAKRITGNADEVIAEADKTVKGNGKAKPATKKEDKPEPVKAPEPPKKPEATAAKVAEWVSLLTPTEVRFATPEILDRFRTEADGLEIKPDDKKRLDLLETAAVNHNKAEAGRAKPRGVLTGEKIDNMEKYLSSGNAISGVKTALKEYEYGEEHFERLEQLFEKYKDNTGLLL
jgi:PRTRC genetic system protein E